MYSNTIFILPKIAHGIVVFIHIKCMAIILNYKLSSQEPVVIYFSHKHKIVPLPNSNGLSAFHGLSVKEKYMSGSTSNTCILVWYMM